MHDGIAWTTVQRILIDAPSYDLDEEGTTPKGDPGDMKLTSENADQIMNYVNSLL